jgi:hypothetical protein
MDYFRWPYIKSVLWCYCYDGPADIGLFAIPFLSTKFLTHQARWSSQLSVIALYFWNTNPQKCMREWSYSPWIDNFDLKWRLVLSFVPRPLSVWERARLSIGFEVGWAPSSSLGLWRKKNLRPFWKSKPNSSIFQPVAYLLYLLSNPVSYNTP